jgi:hypothetical protein
LFVVVNGGHTLAQAPAQLDLLPLSATQRYSARPEASVRKVPAEPLAVPTAAPFDDGVEDAVAEGEDEADWAAAVLELELELLPQAARSNATPATAARAAARRYRGLVILPIDYLRFRLCCTP